MIIVEDLIQSDLLHFTTTHPCHQSALRRKMNVQIQREEQRRRRLCRTPSRSWRVLIFTAVEMQVTHAGEGIFTAAAPLQSPGRTAESQTCTSRISALLRSCPCICTCREASELVSEEILLSKNLFPL